MAFGKRARRLTHRGRARIARATAAVFVLGAIVLASRLASRPDGGPSVAFSLMRAWTLTRRAVLLGAAIPAYLAPPPLIPFHGLLSPWRVAIQVGHWKIEEIPPEQAHLQENTGAYAAGVHEVDVNLSIARLTAEDLRLAGVKVTLLPATVPPGFQADAVVAIHADGGDGRHRGFKVASPWRSSPASRILGDDLERSYGLLTGMPEDRYGITFLMKGYYAFSWTRYTHAISPWTPAAIIETGYLTSAADRTLLTQHPEISARAISQGILMFLGRTAALTPADYATRAYSPMVVSADRAPLRMAAGDNERIAGMLPQGTWVRPLDEDNGWVEVMVWGDYRVFGWMKETDLGTAAGA